MTHGDGLRDHRADKEIGGVREENDKCLSHQSEDRQLWITEKRQDVEQEVALGKRGIVYQYDPTHVDVLVKDLGLEHGNSVPPATPDVMEEEEPEPLSQVQHQQYRSQVARCLFLSQDRADIAFIVNELCQKMSSPNQQSLTKLKRLARFLKRERQWVTSV